MSTVALHDEVAAKRVESQLVELGARYTEALLTIGWLDTELEDSKCRALLLRMKQHIYDDEADLARLMCEAQKQLRGS
jgi:cob(I)alamin adenosyltransferase